MTEVEKQKSIALITAWVQKMPQMRRMASNFSSYFLKYLAEWETGVYVTNEEFHEIMKQSGFRHKPDGDSPNHLFNVSEKWVRETETRLLRKGGPWRGC